MDQEINVIESDHVERDYGFRGTDAVIEHPTHGRLLLSDGYGELGNRGGKVRWEHGTAVKLQPGDTLGSLRSTEWNDWMNLFSAVKTGCDESRPVLDWSGDMVAAVAKSAGLK